MKSTLFRVSIAFVTFLIGVAAAVTFAKLFSALEVTSDVIASQSETVSTWRLPKFIGVSRGCGLGYVQTHYTENDEEFSEGVKGFLSRKEARKEFNGQKRKGRIIEIVREHRDHKGNLGERVIMETRSTSASAPVVSILFYDRGDYCRFIRAPSLDFLLEFERYLISNDYRSAF